MKKKQVGGLDTNSGNGSLDYEPTDHRSEDRSCQWIGQWQPFNPQLLLTTLSCSLFSALSLSLRRLAASVCLSTVFISQSVVSLLTVCVFLLTSVSLQQYTLFSDPTKSTARKVTSAFLKACLPTILKDPHNILNNDWSLSSCDDGHHIICLLIHCPQQNTHNVMEKREKTEALLLLPVVWTRWLRSDKTKD